MLLPGQFHLLVGLCSGGLHAVASGAVLRCSAVRSAPPLGPLGSHLRPRRCAFPVTNRLALQFRSLRHFSSQATEGVSFCSSQVVGFPRESLMRVATLCNSKRHPGFELSVCLVASAFAARSSVAWEFHSSSDCMCVAERDVCPSVAGLWSRCVCENEVGGDMSSCVGPFFGKAAHRSVSRRSAWTPAYGWLRPLFAR